MAPFPARFLHLFAPATICVLISCQSTAPLPAPAAATVAGNGSSAPEIVGVAPESGAGRSQRFEIIASQPAAPAQGIESVQLLVDTVVRGSEACWIDYRVSSRSVTLRSDDGRSWMPAVAAGQGGTLENGQCAVATQNVSAVLEGNQLMVVFPVSFKGGMRGDRNVYALASSFAEHTGWHLKGRWTIQ